MMTKILCLNPGHGGKFIGAAANGLLEKDVNLKLALKVEKRLLANWQGIKIVMTRRTDASIDLETTVKICNDAKADYLHSIHCNGHSDPTAHGYSSYVWNGSLLPATLEMQRVCHEAMMEQLAPLGIRDRGMKRANFYICRLAKCSVVLTENLFITNPTEAAKLKDDAFLDILANGHELGIARAMKLKAKEIITPNVTPVIGHPQATVLQAQEWAKNRGAHQRFIDIAPIYWQYATVTGIRPEALYSQAGKETNFGKYTGVVKPEQNNWAGIKTANATGDKPEDHETFATPEDGVRAHFNHICAYVGKDPIGEPHGRYHVVKSLSWSGTVKTVEELGGKWAPATGYGKSIVNDYLNGLLVTKAPEDDKDKKILALETELARVNTQLGNKIAECNEMQADLKRIAAIGNKYLMS